MKEGGVEVEEEIWQKIDRRRAGETAGREIEEPAGREEWRTLVPEKEKAEEERDGLADECAQWQEIAAIAETIRETRGSCLLPVSFNFQVHWQQSQDGPDKHQMNSTSGPLFFSFFWSSSDEG